ncbi:hypothetical protein JNUCC0626_14005 [Lentzea sp. JNUCC 0626]|uniref:hypothetical protein n=1 Tax=Lentzea sp. JNUCC 0626 TaxID=3367513 RepID=UPI003749B970
MQSQTDSVSGRVEPGELLEDVCERVRALAARRAELVCAAFVTGSYIAGQWDRERPSLNVYLIAADHQADALRLELAAEWAALREELAGRDWELLIDCHPYTVSHRPIRASRLLTVTTKVLEHEHADIRYRLPPTIGPGWCLGFRMLHGDEADVLLLAGHPRRDAEWARTLHRALSHYRNVLDHLPWALDWHNRPEVLVEESSRYAEEAFKDAISFGLRADELAAGRHMALLADWAVSAREHVAERFGPAGLVVADEVSALKRQRGRDCSRAEAERNWLRAKAVWEWAWNQYLDVAAELLPGQADFARVDAFV